MKCALYNQCPVPHSPEFSSLAKEFCLNSHNVCKRTILRRKYGPLGVLPSLLPDGTFLINKSVYAIK